MNLLPGICLVINKDGKLRATIQRLDGICTIVRY
jgi:hypothetical protein